MSIKKPIYWVLPIVSLMIPAFTGVAAAMELAKNKARRAAENMLLRGVQFYERNDMESAMESFMEVMRMGGTAEEAAMAREYLERINLRMAGHKAADMPRSSSSSASGVTGYLLPSISTDLKTKKNKEADADFPSLELNSTPSPEAPEALVERRFAENRLRILERAKKKEKMSVLLKNADKFLALSVDDSLIFSKNVDFKAESGEVLDLLAEILFFHPRHMIRIYPGWSGGKASIQDLQRAAVMGSYLNGRGLAAERIKVELEKSPQPAQAGKQARDWEALLASRERRILFYLEEIDKSSGLESFFTRFLPRSPEAAGRPVISLGVSKEKIDTAKEEGAVIEFFTNANPAPVAQWRLFLKNDSGGLIMMKEGSKAAMESIYFDGRFMQNGVQSFLPSGRYFFEAESITTAGAKISASTSIEIEGGGFSAAQAGPKRIEESKPVSTPKQVPVKTEGSKTVKKPAAKAKPAAKKPAPAPAAEDEPEDTVRAKVPERMLRGEAMTYKITFLPGSNTVSDNQSMTLSQIGSAAKTYPQQKFLIIGVAAPDEKEPAKLAEERARGVARLLSAKHGVAGSRMDVNFGVGNKGQREVEISIEE